MSRSPTHPWRNWALLACLLIAGGLLTARLVQLQISMHEGLSLRAQRNTLGRITIPGPRGRILDRRGHVLAISVPTHVLLALPAEIPRSGLRQLERAANAPRRLTSRALRETWIPVTTQCSETCADQVRRLVESGSVPAEAVHLEPSFGRRYPLGSLAAHVLGFVNRDGTPEGIERRYDDLLRGSDRELRLVRDAKRKIFGSLGSKWVSTPPSSVMLTIDLRVQQRLEKVLKETVLDHRAKRAMGVVLDPDNGDVLAMATYPSFDPNHYSKRVAFHRNAVVGNAFEPGSVIKPLTAAALIESSAVSPSKAIYCEKGRWYWAGEGKCRPIRDHHAFEWLTLPQALEASSNIGIAKFSLSLEPIQLYTVLHRFGLGQRTGIDLPAEARGRLKPPEQWHGRDRLAVAFGHSLTVTPLQLASAYATLANDGIRVPPRLARAWGTPDGTWHLLRASRAAQRSISSTTARQVAHWLEAVITGEHGTGHRAMVSGYRVAGKTGTAEKAGVGGYDRRRNVSSFAGFAPVSDPAVVVAISVDEPSQGPRDAGSVAAPAFAAVMSETLRVLRIPPDDPVAPIAVTASNVMRTTP